MGMLTGNGAFGAFRIKGREKADLLIPLIGHPIPFVLAIELEIAGLSNEVLRDNVDCYQVFLIDCSGITECEWSIRNHRIEASPRARQS